MSGSRGTVEALRAWAGPAGVATAVPAEAARDAVIVLNATPGTAAVEAVTGCAVPDGTILLDVSNPLDFSTGEPAVPTAVDDSVGEQLQRAFPTLRVVKSLCTVNNAVMVAPAMLPEPTTMFVAGDDAAAKQAVSELLQSLGWAADQVLDLGGIESAQQMERNILMWLRISAALGTMDFNVRIVRGT